VKTVQTSHLTLPALGFGTWELEDVTANVRHAIDVGYRHIDTAQIYGNEAEVGRGIAEGGVDRDALFVTTKVWRTNAEASKVVSSTEESLRRLELDHVDLLLLHWPSDEVAPLGETLEAMDALRERGLTRHIGVSNFPSDRLREAAALAPIVNDQVEHHPYLAIDAIREVATAKDLFVTAYSPMARGEVLDDPVITEIAAAHHASAAQVALAWVLAQPVTVTIPKSNTPERITENLAAAQVELTAEEVERIDQLARGSRQVDPPFAPTWDAA
jgi:diketogulonate reductase-like aldo/keto reductase